MPSQARTDAEKHARAVLGVAPAATTAEITTAYRALVRQLHPDHGRRSIEEQKRLADVLAAYRTLRLHPAHEPDPDAEPAAPQERSDGPHIEVTNPPSDAIPINVRHGHHVDRQPDLTIGPVRRHTG